MKTNFEQNDRLRPPIQYAYERWVDDYLEQETKKDRKKSLKET